MFETFDHTADVGLRIKAASFAEILADAAHGLTSLLVANPHDIAPKVHRTFQVAGTEPDYLLFDWLNELLFAYATEQLLFRSFHVDPQPDGIVIQAAGEPADPVRHQLEHEIKAITYHGLRVDRDAENQWSAEVIVDI